MSDELSGAKPAVSAVPADDPQRKPTTVRADGDAKIRHIGVAGEVPIRFF
ncbi:MAG TPA: hypothetical protein VGF20_09785 [Candidatus Acidoferrum sp.]